MKILKGLILTIAASIFSLTAYSAYAAMNGQKQSKGQYQGQYREFKETAEKKLQVMEVKLEKIGEKAEQLSGEAKRNLKAKHEDLVAFKDRLEEQLEQAEKVGQDKWAALKDEIATKTVELEQKIDQALE